MKTKTSTAKPTTTATQPGKPAPFKTPHEKATAAKANAKPKKTAKTPKTTPAGTRDAFGGRIGTRMSAINLIVINAGAEGATIGEVAAQTGETVSIVGAQLGWMVSHKRVATRKEETVNGKKTFRYFAKLN